MNLINEKITHTVFGDGQIIGHDDTIVTIEFDDDDTKKFVYPDAFREFITLKDEASAKVLEKVLVRKAIEEKALNKIREAEREKMMAEQRRQEILKNHRIHESSQIVFWLDEEEQKTVFTEWEVFTGRVQSGKSKGQPNRAARLHTNSAALLTARSDDQEETERRILGLYMVNESLSETSIDDGMIPSHEDFRIELTEEESDKMLFWNYYINKNYPHRTAWNSGKYRYYDNDWTAQILTDIIALRTEEEAKPVQAFLEYFCEMNAIDIDNIPEPSGALKQEEEPAE